MKEMILLISTLVFFFLGYYVMGKVDLFLHSILPFEDFRTEEMKELDKMINRKQ